MLIKCLQVLQIFFGNFPLRINYIYFTFFYIRVYYKKRIEESIQESTEVNIQASRNKCVITSSCKKVRNKERVKEHDIMRYLTY